MFLIVVDLCYWVLLILSLGFFLRSCHIIYVSFLFLFIYLHFCKLFLFFLMFDFSFGVWFCGFLLYFLIVILTFLGYVLPCTQMSYWGLTVFSNLFTAIPLFGYLLIIWFWGSDFIQDFTLVKCHLIHLALPFLLFFFIFLHLFILHYYMSSDGFLDRFCFYLERLLFCTFMLCRDFFLFFCFCFFFVFLVWLAWFFVFHEESFLICNLVKTSDKVLPEWFFLFFFGFIKSVPDKFLGLCFLFMFLLFSLFLGSCYFEYFGRVLFVFMFNFFFLFFVFIQISCFACLVLLMYPCYLELQFFILLLFMYFIIRI